MQNKYFTTRLTQLGYAVILASLSVFTQAEEPGDDTVSKKSTGQLLTRQSTVIELQSTIVGNKEQPEVIYIVPWQPLNAPSPSYRPVQSLVEDQIQLLDRDEWRRRSSFEALLNNPSNQSLSQ